MNGSLSIANLFTKDFLRLLAHVGLGHHLCHHILWCLTACWTVVEAPSRCTLLFDQKGWTQLPWHWCKPKLSGHIVPDGNTPYSFFWWLSGVDGIWLHGWALLLLLYSNEMDNPFLVLWNTAGYAVVPCSWTLRFELQTIRCTCWALIDPLQVGLPLTCNLHRWAPGWKTGTEQWAHFKPCRYTRGQSLFNVSCWPSMMTVYVHTAGRCCLYRDTRADPLICWLPHALLCKTGWAYNCECIQVTIRGDTSRCKLACHQFLLMPWPAPCSWTLPTLCFIEVATLSASVEEEAIQDAPGRWSHMCTRYCRG